MFLSQSSQANGAVPQDFPSFRNRSHVPDCYKLGDFHKPLFRFNNLLIKLMRPVYLLLSVYYDWYFKGHKWVVRWRDARGEVHTILHTGTSVSGVWDVPCSRIMDAFCPPTQKLFKPLCLGFFFPEILLCRHGWLDLWPLALNSICSLCPFPPRGGGRVESFNPLI